MENEKGSFPLFITCTQLCKSLHWLDGLSVLVCDTFPLDAFLGITGSAKKVLVGNSISGQKGLTPL